MPYRCILQTARLRDGLNVNIRSGTDSAEKAVPKILAKFSANISTHFSLKQQRKIEEACKDSGRMQKLSVSEFMDLFLI